MKIVAISDLHGTLPTNINTCDVVCICGDIVPLSVQKDLISSISWFLLDFKPWAESLPCDKVIFIAGNHDFMFETLGMHRLPDDILKILLGNHKKSSKLVYLCDSVYEYKSVKFYGTPWCPELKNWAFYGGNPEELKLLYSNIPEKVDVLLTHCPPMVGNAGVVLQEDNIWNYKKNFGSPELAEVISNRDIKWCLCGHIHSGDHNITQYLYKMNIVNVSLKDEKYKVTYKPFEFEIDT